MSQMAKLQRQLRCPTGHKKRWPVVREIAAEAASPPGRPQNAMVCPTDRLKPVTQEEQAEACVTKLRTQHLNRFGAADLLYGSAEFAVGTNLDGDIKDHGKISWGFQAQTNLRRSRLPFK